MIEDQRSGVTALGILFIGALTVGAINGFNGVIWAIAAIGFLRLQRRVMRRRSNLMTELRKI